MATQSETIPMKVLTIILHACLAVSRRLYHTQDRFQHSLEIGDFTFQSLPSGGRQLVVAGAAVVL
jgi:hypothetical protein